MPKSGETGEIGEEDGDDFGGEQSPADEKKQRASETKAIEESRIETRKAPLADGDNSHIQHNQGPGPSMEYGDSVPVEGKRNEGPTDFNHPAGVEPQRIVWIPQDPLGISVREVQRLQEEGVEVSDENAILDKTGTVDITNHPPGMDPTSI
jgi:hypothetical protein